MSGTKISELPVATLPLTGAEIVPVVQSGATKQANLSAMPYVPAGTGAVTTTVQAKLRETVSVKDFGAVGDGVTDDGPAFRNALIALSNGGKLIVPSATYYFNVTGDATSLVVPSNVEIAAEPGTVFKWAYWGSPLLAIVNKQNVYVKNIKFVWSGTFGTTSGARDGFGWGTTTPAYEYCAHVLVFGSDNVSLTNLECAGNTTSNVQNNFISVNGKSDGSKSSGLQIFNITSNDVCQTIVGSNQTQFSISNLFSNRYSNASNALYGPAHVIYATGGWTYGYINDIVDLGTKLNAYTSGAQTLSIKTSNDVVVTNIQTKRDEGSLNYQNLNRCVFDGIDDIASTRTADTNVSCIFDVQATTSNNDNIFRNIRVFVDTANRAIISTPLSGIDVTKYSNNRWQNVTVKHEPGAGYTAAIFALVGNTSILQNYTYLNNGTADKVALQLNGNNIISQIQYAGTRKSPRIEFSSGYTGNVLTVDTPEGNYYNNNVVPAGNTLEYVTKSVSQSVSLGTATNPTPTFQLPSPGAYLVHVVVSTRSGASYGNHAFGGLYQVVWDDASLNDFTVAQLIGTQISKGTSITALSVAVNNTGLVTVTTTTANTNWWIDYSWTYLHQ